MSNLEDALRNAEKNSNMVNSCDNRRPTTYRLTRVIAEIKTSGLEMYTGIGGIFPMAPSAPGMIGGGFHLRAPSAPRTALDLGMRHARSTEYFGLGEDAGYDFGVTHHSTGLGKLKVYDKTSGVEYGVPVADIGKPMRQWRIDHTTLVLSPEALRMIDEYNRRRAK